MSDPSRGPEGREGPVGREGIAGREGLPGIHGVVGPEGQKGERGKQGEALPRQVTLAFLFLVGTFVVVLAVLSYFIVQNRELLSDVQRNDRAVEAARVERVKQINTVNTAQCASLRNLYGVIRKALTDSDEAIDKIQYYRDHPDELAEAHRRSSETIAQFRAPPCPPNVQLPTLLSTDQKEEP